VPHAKPQPIVTPTTGSAGIDPVLLDQLRGSTGMVDALVALRAHPGSSESMKDAGEVQRVARMVVARAEHLTRESAVSCSIFGYLGTFGVVGRPALIRAILDQPEVLSAQAAEHS